MSVFTNAVRGSTALIAAALVALPLAASGETASERLLNGLMQACSAAITGNFPTGTQGMLGTSADGKINLWSGGATSEDAEVMSTFLTVSTLPGGTTANCTVSVMQPHPGAFDDLVAVIESRQGDILGSLANENITAGGQIGNLPGGEGELWLWARPEFPPTASIHAIIGPTLISLTFAGALTAEQVTAGPPQ
ncbi:MAG: hypothetical protein Q4G25_12220 [Paracoccus sp. (in: a-proteobacteria)]|nr:hypothetical protein [Paracoccus sp. (in: a-proteobacteria)]